MPIYKYEEGEHGSGFIGLRVAVMVNNELKQKYFSFLVRGKNISAAQEEHIKKQALELDERWQFSKRAAQEKRLNQAKEHKSSVYATGVRGIRMKFIIEKKIRAGERRTYFTPKFIVTGSNDNIKFGKNFNILTQGYNNAWTNAVLYYAMNKNLTNPDALLERVPPVEKFMIIIKYMNKLGYKVPKKRLPVELWNNSQVKAVLGEHEKRFTEKGIENIFIQASLK